MIRLLRRAKIKINNLLIRKWRCYLLKSINWGWIYKENRIKLKKRTFRLKKRKFKMVCTELDQRKEKLNSWNSKKNNLEIHLINFEKDFINIFRLENY